MPFKHINRQELRESITKHNHDELPDDIPNEIKEIISDCFKKDPKKRKWTKLTNLRRIQTLFA